MRKGLSFHQPALRGLVFEMIEIKALASGSKGNCYLISDNSTNIIIECGISIDRIRRGGDFMLGEIKACLISHEH